jgi:hypothetical protein
MSILLMSWFAQLVKSIVDKLLFGHLQFVGDIQSTGDKPIVFSQAEIPEVTAYIPQVTGLLHTSRSQCMQVMTTSFFADWELDCPLLACDLSLFENSYIDWGTKGGAAIYEQNCLMTDAIELLGEERARAAFSICKQYTPG